MRCLSCEIHVIYRIVARFTREAVIAQKHVPILEKFKDTHSAFIRWETPEFNTSPKGRVSMKGAVATIIVDRLLPNQQKRTINAFADGFNGEFNEEDLEEGFIEIHEVSDVVELLDWDVATVPTKSLKKKVQCNAKRKK